MQLTHQELITLAEGQNRLFTARAAFIAQLRAEGQTDYCNRLEAIQEAEKSQWQHIIDQVNRIEITARKGATV